MLRLTKRQPDFWDELLPADVRRQSAELTTVDDLLDDERFLAPFVTRFPSKRGRQTIPMETYLRLMYLKVRYGFGYESLVAEVSDSVSWRRFCRVSLSERVPDASTLIKLTNGPCRGLAEEVHTALVQKLAEKKVLKGRKLRVDTTVVEADIHYPTDADLLADGVRVLTRTTRQLQQENQSSGKPFKDVGRTVKKGLLTLGKGLKAKGGDTSTTRASVTADILGIAEDVVRRATRIRAKVAQGVATTERAVPDGVHRRLRQLGTWLERTERIIEQTKQVLGGNVHVKNRLVSLFDPDARPIRKGQLKVAGGTQFGYKAVVADDEAGFVTDVHVVSGNPEDRTLLVAAVQRHCGRVHQVPRAVAADRGMTSAANDVALADLGVTYRSLPRQGSLTPLERDKEHQPWFRQLQRFRAGGEARISLLKRKYGWRRSRLRGLAGVQTWLNWGVIAHNLTKYARLQLVTAA